MFDASRYTISIKKIDEDGQTLYQATVKELPDVGPYAENPQQAYELALEIIKTLNEMAAEEGRKFPAPSVTETEFSGRFTLRLPKTLHRKAAQLSDSEGVSLNQYFVSMIAESVGERKALKMSNALATTTKDYWTLMASQLTLELPHAVATDIFSYMMPITTKKQCSNVAATASIYSGEYITETTHVFIEKYLT